MSNQDTAKQAHPEPVNAGLVELLEPAFTEIQHALGSTLEFPYQRKSLETALELVRAAITAIKQSQAQSQEQAPGEAAREFMAGYSDGIAWAQLSQAQGFNNAINFAIEQGMGCSDFLQAWREGDTSE